MGAVPCRAVARRRRVATLRSEPWDAGGGGPAAPPEPSQNHPGASRRRPGLIWNRNQAKLTDRGFCRTRIYVSADGATWRPLTRSVSIELPRASGLPYALPTTVPNDAPPLPLRSVIIAAEPTDGNYGSDAYGLSAVFALR